MNFIVKLFFIVFLFFPFLDFGFSMSIPGISKAKEVVVFSPLSGRLEKSGVPMANVDLILKIKIDKKTKEYIYKTDSEGHFSLPKITEAMIVSPFAQMVVTHRISVFDHDGEEIKIWRANKMDPDMFSETGGQVEGLICDLESSPVTHEEFRGIFITLCKWKNIKR